MLLCLCFIRLGPGLNCPKLLGLSSLAAQNAEILWILYTLPPGFLKPFIPNFRYGYRGDILVLAGGAGGGLDVEVSVSGRAAGTHIEIIGWWGPPALGLHRDQTSETHARA